MPLFVEVPSSLRNVVSMHDMQDLVSDCLTVS
jgi:hypothetical protein